MKPILVIADDLTGAAEMGGVALRHGLSAQITHTLDEPVATDVLILNTNTRSMKIGHALQHLRSIGASRHTTSWNWIYLKFDSALRGHMHKEIPFYKTLFGAKQVFFCPVNWQRNRVIQEGIYLVGGVPIAETDFANDPEFPVRQSRLTDILGIEHWRLLPIPEAVTDEDVYVIPAVAAETELNRWAAWNGAQVLFAGAAAFFEALLRHRAEKKQQAAPVMDTPGSKKLYICGSKHEASVRRLHRLDPARIVHWHTTGEEKHVAQALQLILERNGVAVLAVAPEAGSDACIIRKSMATSVALLNEQYPLPELIIEGGATAGAILEALRIDTLRPLQEKGPGVITCAVPDTGMLLTLKPGSYPWTKELWVF